MSHDNEDLFYENVLNNSNINTMSKSNDSRQFLIKSETKKNKVKRFKKQANDIYDILTVENENQISTSNSESEDKWGLTIATYIISKIYKQRYPNLRFKKIVSVMKQPKNYIISYRGDCIKMKCNHNLNLYAIIDEIYISFKCINKYCQNLNEQYEIKNTEFALCFKNFETFYLLNSITTLFNSIDPGITKDMIYKSDDFFVAQCTKDLIQDLKDEILEDKKDKVILKININLYQIYSKKSLRSKIIEKFSSFDFVKNVILFQNGKEMEFNNIRQIFLTEDESNLPIEFFFENNTDLKIQYLISDLKNTSLGESIPLLCDIILKKSIFKKLAKLFLLVYSTKYIAYDNNIYYIYLPNEGIWLLDCQIAQLRSISEQCIFDYIKNVEETINNNKYDSLYHDIKAHISNSTCSNCYLKSLKLAIKRKCKIPNFEDFLDNNRKIIVFSDCVLDLMSVNVFQHSHQFYSSQKINYNFPKTVPNDDFILKTIRNMFSDEKVFDYLLDFLASCLTDDIPNNTLHIFVGAGRNGKSVLSKIIAKVLGCYAATYPHSLLSNHKDTNIAYNILYHLKNSRIAFGDSIPQHALSTSSIKKILENPEMISTNIDLNKKNTQFYTKTKFVVSCKTIPIFDEVDKSFENIVKIIKFPFVFTASPRFSNEKLDDPTILKTIKNNPTYLHSFMGILLQRFYLLKSNLFNFPLLLSTKYIIDDSDTAFIEWISKNIISSDKSSYLTFKDIYCKYTSKNSLLLIENNSKKYKTLCSIFHEHLSLNKQTFPYVIYKRSITKSVKKRRYYGITFAPSKISEPNKQDISISQNPNYAYNGFKNNNLLIEPPFLDVKNQFKENNTLNPDHVEIIQENPENTNDKLLSKPDISVLQLRKRSIKSFNNDLHNEPNLSSDNMRNKKKRKRMSSISKNENYVIKQLQKKKRKLKSELKNKYSQSCKINKNKKLTIRNSSSDLGIKMDNYICSTPATIKSNKQRKIINSFRSKRKCLNKTNPNSYISSDKNVSINNMSMPDSLFTNFQNHGNKIVNFLSSIPQKISNFFSKKK